MPSFYNRTDNGEVTVFSVTPAPYPGAAQGNVALFGGIVLAVLSVPMMVVLIGFLLLPLSIVFIFAGLKLRNRFNSENANRFPQEVRVSAEGVSVAAVKYGIGDIAEFTVTHSMAGPERVHYERVDNVGRAMGATLRENTQNAQHYVSYQASVRLRSDSRPAILVGGLTNQTAESLKRDLADALEDVRRSKATA